MKLLKITLAVLLFYFILMTRSNAATLYWTGGDGNWNDPAHWSTDPMNPRLTANVTPTAGDDVVFDSISTGLSSNATITLDGKSYCKNISVLDLDYDTIGFTNTNSNLDTLFINGGISLNTGGFSWNFNGITVFTASSADNAIHPEGQNFNCNVIFNGSGSWKIGSNDHITFSTPSFIILKKGALNIDGNGQTESIANCDKFIFEEGTLNATATDISCKEFLLIGTATKNLNLQNTNINLETRWSADGASAGSVTISGKYNIRMGAYPSSTEFKGNGLTYDNLIVKEGGNTCAISGINTFNKIILENGYYPTYLILNDDVIISELIATAGLTETIFISSPTGKNFTDNNGGKNCLSNLDINNVNANGAEFNVYHMSGPVGTGWTSAANDFPKAGGVYSSYPAVCPGTSIALNPNNSPTGTFTYQWSAGATIISTLSSVASYTPTQTTVFTFSITDTGTGCSTKDTAVVYVMGQIPPDAGSDAAICPGGSINLIAKSTPVYQRYVWSPSNSITGGSPNPWEYSDGSGIVQLTATPTTTTNYTLEVSIADPVTFNYCYSYDYVTITVDTYSITGINPVTPAICIGDSIELTAVGDGSIYSWATGGAVVMPHGDVLKVSPTVTTIYSVEGCVNTQTVTVTVNSLPTTVDVTSDLSLCVGSSVALSASGASSYEWFPADYLAATTGNLTTVTPETTIKYFVTGTDINGCKNKDSVLVFVNPLPTTVDAGTDASICLGSTAPLAASGAINYMWSPADGLSATNISNPDADPSMSTKYYVTGSDVNGCENTDSLTVSINPAAISGTVSYSGGTLSGNSYAKLYKYEIFSEMLMLDSVGVDVDGKYSFNNLTYTDSFIVYVQGDTLSYPNTAGTYYNNTFEWNNADQLFATCPTTSANITLVEIPTETGSNIVAGTIIEGEGYGKTEAAGDGIGGVDVGLKKKPGGQLTATASTDENGDFEMNNLPDGVYEMYINIPGLPMIDNYTITLSASNPKVTSMDFKVDSTQIETTTITSIKKNSKQVSMVKVFPNPAKDIVYISVESPATSKLSIEIIDVLGKNVRNPFNTTISKGVSVVPVNTSELAEGIYWLNLKTDHSLITEKLSIVR